MRYETNIGLEVHLQLSTKTKAFCFCGVEFGASPNSQTCPVCLGLPGSLPVLNRQALRSAVKVAIALNCSVAEKMKFDRKNYYYPDLPKNFQISQYDRPLAQNGYIDIQSGRAQKRIRIKRVHLEEDAGKLLHKEEFSLVDYNRAGTPLLEIVSEPDISSPEEAYNYLTRLKSALRYLDVSDCNMEEGSLRCDANISLRKAGSAGLGTKTELKNMNSFKGVRNALEYEVKRQAEALDLSEEIAQETRLWDADKDVTYTMRSKEEAHDYRYFPEPDLLPFTISSELVLEVRNEIPELPDKRKERFVSQYGIPDYDAAVLTQDRQMADFFEAAAKACNSFKAISNWLMGDVSAYLNEKDIGIEGTRLTPKNLADMIKMVETGRINVRTAKAILGELIETGRPAESLTDEKGLSQISDAGQLEKIVTEAIKANERSAGDYRSGKKNALVFLVGQVMKATHGKANPSLVNEILKEKLRQEGR